MDCATKLKELSSGTNSKQIDYFEKRLYWCIGERRGARIKSGKGKESDSDEHSLWK